jgi:hypothetical protein
LHTVAANDLHGSRLDSSRTEIYPRGVWGGVVRERFTAGQIRAVRAVERRAADLVTRFYALAPREWHAMPYEVRTLRHLAPDEVVDSALAHVLCYGVRRTIDDRVVGERDLFRICLQDHRILRHLADGSVQFPALVMFVLTHELVHVVRFGQRLQALDLPSDLRAGEEASVDKTARLIVRSSGDPGVSAVLERFALPVD